MHALLAVVLVLAPAPTAAASPDEDHAARAGRLFSESRFADAAQAFADAYAATGDAAMLFGQAQALRRAGNCDAAIEVFERFIDSDPPDADADAARGVIDECEQVLGTKNTTPPPPTPTATAPAPEPTPPPAPPPRPQWPRDVAGGVLLGTGLGITAVGAGLLGGSFALANRGRPESETGFEDRGARVRALSGAGITALVVGGALLVGAVVRYVIVARRERGAG